MINLIYIKDDSRNVSELFNGFEYFKIESSYRALQTLDFEHFLTKTIMQERFTKKVRYREYLIFLNRNNDYHSPC